MPLELRAENKVRDGADVHWCTRFRGVTPKSHLRENNCVFLIELHVQAYMNTSVFTARASIRAACLKSEVWRSRLMK